MAPVVQHARKAAALEVMAQDIPRSILRRFARQQRAQAVQAETLIWRSVRNRRCDGAKFQSRFLWAILSLILSASNVGWLWKLTVQAMRSRRNGLPTMAVTPGCENKAFGFLGCRTNL